MSPPVNCLNREAQSAVNVTVGSSDRGPCHDIKIPALLIGTARIVFYKMRKTTCKILHVKNIKSVKSSSLQPCQEYCYLYCFQPLICNIYHHSFEIEHSMTFFPLDGFIGLPNMNHVTCSDFPFYF